MRRLIATCLALLALAGCAPQVARVASVSPPQEKPVWAFEASDIPVDPGYRFGRLANGMRYVIRHNETPKGTGSVRMEIAAGSLDESDSERGFAHFVEHMAFNGSTNVPEGEMVHLLEREGLAFGADTNAQTSFEQTTYLLDLPRNDPSLLGTALMLMRETAGGLLFDSKAVARERGVVLSEMRDRNSWQYRNQIAQLGFLTPDARYVERLPIGTADALNAATSEGLKAFWQRNYVPGKTTLIVIGDFDADAVEAAIKARFENWQAAPSPPQPGAGPIDPARSGQTEIYIDPALSERLAISRHGPWLYEPDSAAQRRENLLRQIGYAIVNRRLQRISRLPAPPFRDAGIGTADLFKAGRTTNLIVDTVDGKWRRGLIAAALEYRKAMRFGFTQSEVAEQLANVRTALENDAASAGTRSHGALLNAVFALLRKDEVPATPESALARFNANAGEINSKSVFAAMLREAVPLTNPLLRFQGRRDPEGGAPALRAAWNEAMRQGLKRDRAAATSSFAYTNFGPPGTVANDTTEPALGIHSIRFANGVMLNLKRTDLEKDRLVLQLAVDGGARLNTPEKPLTTEMMSALTSGGLGKHSQDELQSLLAGHTVSFTLDTGPDAFVSSAQTTPRDLEFQLQVLAALISDPGYRSEGELRYRLNVNNYFAQLRATPQSALSSAIGGILSDGDLRFTLQGVEVYRKLTFAELKEGISDRLAHGAIELGMVGDFDEAQVIAAVAKTFGALPPREAQFGSFDTQPKRPFTASREPRILRHTGPKDQALLRLTWPTRDDSDPAASIGLSLVERIVQLELTDTLREKLGKAYSPSANSNPSRYWRGYGVFGIAASIDVANIATARAAMAETIKRLREVPVSADEMQRARQPQIEALENALKTNRGWLGFAARAQSEADRIARFVQAKQQLEALTAADIQQLAARYLVDATRVEVLVLPEGVDEPKP